MAAQLFVFCNGCRGIPFIHRVYTLPNHMLYKLNAYNIMHKFDYATKRKKEHRMDVIEYLAETVLWRLWEVMSWVQLEWNRCGVTQGSCNPSPDDIFLPCSSQCLLHRLDHAGEPQHPMANRTFSSKGMLDLSCSQHVTASVSVSH